MILRLPTRLRYVLLVVFLSTTSLPACSDLLSGDRKEGTLSGEVQLRNAPQGPIFVLATRRLDTLIRRSPEHLITLEQPGPFRIENITPGRYYVAAYVDSNRDTVSDIFREPFKLYAEHVEVKAGQDITGIVLKDFYNEKEEGLLTEETERQIQDLLAKAGKLIESARESIDDHESILFTSALPGVQARLLEVATVWKDVVNHEELEHIISSLQRIVEDCQSIQHGIDPYESRTGAFIKGYYVGKDASVLPYAVYVPTDYAQDKKYPLVVALPGASMTPRATMQATFGVADDLALILLSQRRPFPDFPQVDFIVACPTALGGVRNRAWAQKDVLRVIGEVKKHYNIDDDRIYLTGISDGGTLTWHIGLLNPHVFAALAPVCGAGIVFLDLARNALNLPVHVFHGEIDSIIPVKHSRAIVNRLKEVGVNVTYTEYPGVEHDCARLVYKDGKIFELFSEYRRNLYPRTVSFTTMNEEYGRCYWITVREKKSRRDRASVYAAVEPDNVVRIATFNLRKFSLSLSQELLDMQRPVTILCDGSTTVLDQPSTAAVVLIKVTDPADNRKKWRVAEAERT